MPSQPISVTCREIDQPASQFLSRLTKLAYFFFAACGGGPGDATHMGTLCKNLVRPRGSPAPRCPSTMGLVRVGSSKLRDTTTTRCTSRSRESWYGYSRLQAASAHMCGARTAAAWPSARARVACGVLQFLSAALEASQPISIRSTDIREIPAR